MTEKTESEGAGDGVAASGPGIFSRERLRAYGILAGAVIAGFIVAGWLVDAAPGFQQRRLRNNTIAPQLAAARALGLTYDGILAAPDKAMGKPALWCIQNRGADGVFYDGDQGKRLFVDPSSQELPPVPVGKHEACREMLVTVSGFKVDSAVPGALYIYIKFIAEP